MTDQHAPCPQCGLSFAHSRQLEAHLIDGCWGKPAKNPELVEKAEVAAAVRSALTRATILRDAEKLINGDRAKDYGDARENFARIAHGWSSILGHDVTAVQVALCMDWLKTCRLITSPGHADSWIDKCGYSALGGEVAANAG